MATVLLFHHLQGLTPGVVAFADALREAGHTVHTPDLFGGRTFACIKDGAAFTRSDDAPDVDALAAAAAASSTSASRSGSCRPSGSRRRASARPAPCCASPAYR